MTEHRQHGFPRLNRLNVFENPQAGKALFEVPEDSVFFRGHFEGNPLLPGVVSLVEMALATARTELFEPRPLSEITRLKFQHAIVPGDRVLVSCEKENENIRFALRNETGEKSFAQGVFKFGSAILASDERLTLSSGGEYAHPNSFMPHRAPMLWIDRLVEHEGDRAVTSHIVSESDLLVQQGKMEMACSIEFFAQTAAAHVGFEASKHSAPMAGGALLGARKMEFFAPSFEVGDEIFTEAVRTMQMPPLAQYECRLFRNDCLISKGSINVAMIGAPSQQV